MSAASAQDVEAPYFYDGSAYRETSTGRTLARSAIIFLLVLCITFFSLYSRAGVAEPQMCPAYDALDRQVHFAYAALEKSLSDSGSADAGVCAFDSHTSVLRITGNASQTLALFGTILRADRTQYVMMRDAKGFSRKTVVSMELVGAAYMMRSRHCPVALSEVRMADVAVSVDTETTVQRIKLIVREKIAEFDATVSNLKFDDEDSTVTRANIALSYMRNCDTRLYTLKFASDVYQHRWRNMSERPCSGSELLRFVCESMLSQSARPKNLSPDLRTFVFHEYNILGDTLDIKLYVDNEAIEQDEGSVSTEGEWERISMSDASEDNESDDDDEAHLFARKRKRDLPSS
ncbi:hypothetical protein CYMTET_8123 [Cymbomonas tetramitiformis]|uniref:Uncharacterized protein n=1 Tax=Cymbomonas tetramitiformis TaxID=36881 RepID=A0AAE0GU39_9CHLO|nr:hypothetical protein CYMTET_8123 [Cymbomonas tetramitiformis]